MRRWSQIDRHVETKIQHSPMLIHWRFLINDKFHWFIHRENVVPTSFIFNTFRKCELRGCSYKFHSNTTINSPTTSYQSEEFDGVSLLLVLILIFSNDDQKPPEISSKFSLVRSTLPAVVVPTKYLVSPSPPHLEICNFPSMGSPRAHSVANYWRPTLDNKIISLARERGEAGKKLMDEWIPMIVLETKTDLKSLSSIRRLCNTHTRRRNRPLPFPIWTARQDQSLLWPARLDHLREMRQLPSLPVNCHQQNTVEIAFVILN